MNERKKAPYAKKSFGQNFLVDHNYIDKIIKALNPQKGETIVEIGAGRGALTEKLLKSGAKIIAVELEREMIAVLGKTFGAFENFILIEQDALKIDFAELIKTHSDGQNSSPVKLIANLPYYISTAILQKLIEQRAVFAEMILMFQLEVVERISAPAGTKDRGFLTVLVEAYLTTEKLFEVPPSAFRPAPKVRSAVVRLITTPDVFIGDEKLFKELISAGFTQKRKTILNNLKNSPPKLREKIVDVESLLNKAAIESNRRAETLSIAEWQRILAEMIC